MIPLQGDQRAGIRLPDLETIPVYAVRQAAQRWTRARTDLLASEASLRRLEAQRPQAEQADAERLADSIANGRKDPGAQHVQRLEAQLADSRRYAGAARIASERRFAELTAAIEAHEAEWREQVDEQVAAARAALGEHVDRLEAVIHRLEAALGQRSFLASGTPRVSRLPIAVPASAEGVASVDDLLAGLRAAAREPAPVEAARPLRIAG